MHACIWQRAHDITLQYVHCMCASMMEHSFTSNLGTQGYHIYEDGWDKPTGEVLHCEEKSGTIVISVQWQ